MWMQKTTTDFGWFCKCSMEQNRLIHSDVPTCSFFLLRLLATPSSAYSAAIFHICWSMPCTRYFPGCPRAKQSKKQRPKTHIGPILEGIILWYEENKLDEWDGEWRMNEWMNEWTNKRKNYWMNEWMDECMDEWAAEWLCDWVHEGMSEWVMSERMNEWNNECIN